MGLFPIIVPMKTLLLTFLLLVLAHFSKSQCNFNASLLPQSVILCPNETAQLSLNTDAANIESIVWYKWLGFGNFQPEVIPGFANQEQVELNTFEHSGYYFFASVTANGCTKNSDTILVDGYLFLPPVVAHGGTAQLTQNGWEVACGQTATLELMMPYTQSITWFRNGVAIPGETGSVLNIIETGSYTVQGAPELCPALLTPLGLELEYTVLPDPDVTVSVTANQLSVAEGISWQWMYNGDSLIGATQASIEAIVDGEYQVWVDFGDGCTVLSDIVDVVLTATSFNSNRDFHIYPNPFHQFVILEGTDLMSYCIYDLNGSVVSQGTLSGTNTIQLEHLSQGLYIFECKSSQKGNLRRILSKE
jgi:hypothetical protein